jgi:hypothetical protein
VNFDLKILRSTIVIVIFYLIFYELSILNCFYSRYANKKVIEEFNETIQNITVLFENGNTPAINFHQSAIQLKNESENKSSDNTNSTRNANLHEAIVTQIEDKPKRGRPPKKVSNPQEVVSSS